MIRLCVVLSVLALVCAQDPTPTPFAELVDSGFENNINNQAVEPTPEPTSATQDAAPTEPEPTGDSDDVIEVVEEPADNKDLNAEDAPNDVFIAPLSLGSLSSIFPPHNRPEPEFHISQLFPQQSTPPVHSMTLEMELPPMSFPQQPPRAPHGDLFGNLLQALAPAAPQMNFPMFHPHHAPMFHPFGFPMRPQIHPMSFPFMPAMQRPRPQLNGLPIIDMVQRVLGSLPHPHVQDLVEADHEETSKHPMILRLTTHDNFFVVTGFFPGLSKDTLHATLDGQNLILKGQIQNKTPEVLAALEDLKDVDEIDETMELPYAPDAHLFKVHFDDTTFKFTAVFPKQTTTELQFI